MSCDGGQKLSFCFHIFSKQLHWPAFLYVISSFLSEKAGNESYLSVERMSKVQPLQAFVTAHLGCKKALILVSQCILS